MVIECGKLKIPLFIPLIFPLFFQLRTFLISNKGYINDNPFFKLFRYYLSYIISGICILVIRIRTKIHKKRTSTIKELNPNIKNDSNSDWINPLDKQKKIIAKEKNLKIFLFLLILVLLGYISNICDIILKYVFSDEKNEIYISKQSIGIIFKIFYLILLSKIILKMRIYKHHIFSLYIIIFTSTILIISFVLNHNILVIIKIVFYNLLISLFFCLFDILGKKYLNIFCNSPYQIMLKIGILSVIILLIYDIIVLIIRGDENTDISGIIIGFKNNLIKPNFTYIILDILLCFLWNGGIWLTLYYLTPCHFIISESISEYLYYIIDFILGNNEYETRDIIIYGIVYILNIFCFLVYDEIIILNIWDLNKYTKHIIQKRETIDMDLSMKSKNEILDLSSSINEDE